jgi:hypothetical protein
MPISITLQADSFAELADLIRGIPLGNVAVSVPLVAPVSVPLVAPVSVPLVAPVSVPTLVAPPVVTTTTDVEGKTWDAAIHSSSKALNADGTWRKKRGVQADPVSAPVPVAAPMPHEVVAAAPVELNYGSIMTVCGEKMKQGRLDAATLGIIQLEHDLENLSQLVSRPDLIQAVYNRISAL